MEQLSELPPLAMVVFGATLAVIFGVRYMGLLAGAKVSPGASSSAAPIAAVIVDPTALNRASASVEALNGTLIEMVAATKEKTRVNSIMATEMDRIREELRIHRELRRDR